MRVRVPSQASTKWLFLLAAVAATLITWCEASQRPAQSPRRAPREQPIELEIEIYDGSR